MADFRFTLGTRGSPLALAQARMVAVALERAHGWPAGAVHLATVQTSGDRIQDRPLAEVGGKALWTKELDLALLSGETDASVHSMKDIESERPASLRLVATLERGDVRDRLIGAGSIDQLAQGARVGSSSPRRAAQLRRLRPDLVIAPIRGNVDTRLAKRDAGEVEAVVLAAAGLDRLGRLEVGTAIDIAEMLPAPAQGAIAIECRADDGRAAALLAAINHAETFDATMAERAFTRALGGSCHSPVAALARLSDARLCLAVELFSSDGADHLAAERAFDRDDRDGPACFARELLEAAPDSIRILFGGV